ncbi:hypothetical protein ACIQI7_27385 [Kitasatospora sp. NPDC092039]|uniref:hypothetical protein n=1 Tax=Kitasatospora sp. NPDC092039 TaxID=3364086 RepID=UPI0038244B6F
MTELAELVLTPDERARGVRVDRVVFTMDWAGEDHPGRLAEFVAGRVRAFGAEPTGVGTDTVHRAAEDEPTLRRGDLPVRQLDHVADALAELGYTLLVREGGTDAYELLVAPTGEREPTGLTHEGLPVRAWGSQSEASEESEASGATLVSLNCPECAQMLVWELPPSETLADEHCDCGTALFDAAGCPLPNVALHD